MPSSDIGSMDCFKVAIAADSIVGEKLYLHIYLAVRPRISNINYIGLKRASERIWSRNWVW